MAQATVTVWVEAGERVTVKFADAVPEFVSARETSFTDRTGVPSSFRIVPTPVGSAMVEPADAPDRFRVKVSSGSFTVSPTTDTVAVLDSWPEVKVSTPEVAV